MASSGIRDQVAIIGMGCTAFGELWDKGVDDLLTDAANEAVDVGRAPLARHRRLLAGHHDARVSAASRCRGRSSSTTSR